MRLNLLRKDTIRTQIASRKINTKYFESDDVQVTNIIWLYVNTINNVFFVISEYIILRCYNNVWLYLGPQIAFLWAHDPTVFDRRCIFRHL
jgi:hypothetical protein